VAEKKKTTKILQSCLSRAQNLNEMIDYSDDSVVSKTILDKTIGTLTLFAFDAGQRLSEHTSPYDAVVQVVDGKGRFNIAGKSVEASAGELLIMPSNIPHSVDADERFKMLLIMIRE
jgi:quercetin dioxygenase-like cupin family protein